MAYSSNNGSLVVCKIKGSSVESVTLIPILKKSKNGDFAYFKNSLEFNNNNSFLKKSF